jgi:3-deoxy-D-manno-octulosonate 8-phosphate phosphatase (KDO 8-P phosphatase)
MNHLDRFAKIRLLISDVDGVLTSGAIILSDLGHETKIFNVQDGFGIRLLMKQGIAFAIISSRSTPSVTIRMQKLGVQHIYQGNENKLPAFEELLNQLQLSPDQVAYIGDDWPDLRLLERVGLAIAVANAVPEVKTKAHYITSCPGGSGAVREVVMKILQAQGIYEEALAEYIK